MALVALLVSIIIQRRALNRIAFSRSMFITGMVFLCSFLASLTAPNLAVWTVFVIFQLFGWTFLLFMTVRSLRHMRERRQKSVSNRR